MRTSLTTIIYIVAIKPGAFLRLHASVGAIVYCADKLMEKYCMLENSIRPH